MNNTVTGIPATTCRHDSACYQAALRAYVELRNLGILDRDAFNAAVRVFLHHHPDTLPRRAQHIVADWIAPDA